MTDHPSTFQGGSRPGRDFEWDDHSTLHVKGDGQGLFYRFTSVRTGTLAELVRFVTMLSEEKQGDYVIQKSGDRLLSPGEILELSRRDDFPQ